MPADTITQLNFTDSAMMKYVHMVMLYAEVTGGFTHVTTGGHIAQQGGSSTPATSIQSPARIAAGADMINGRTLCIDTGRKIFDWLFISTLVN